VRKDRVAVVVSQGVAPLLKHALIEWLGVDEPVRVFERDSKPADCGQELAIASIQVFLLNFECAPQQVDGVQVGGVTAGKSHDTAE
jgi:hypothetical protein